MFLNSAGIFKTEKRKSMDKKIPQRIAIGLISIFLLALIGLNIYEYQKFKYIPPATEIESSENIKNNSMPAQTSIAENVAKNSQADSNHIDDPPDMQISKIKDLK